MTSYAAVLPQPPFWGCLPTPVNTARAMGGGGEQWEGQLQPAEPNGHYGWERQAGADSTACLQSGGKERTLQLEGGNKICFLLQSSMLPLVS